MRKKICFIYTNIFSLGGIQRVITNLANALQKKYDIYIINIDRIFNKNKVDYNLRNNVHVINLKTSPLGYLCRGIMHFSQSKTINNKIRQIRQIEKKRQIINICNNLKFDSIFAASATECILMADIRKDIECKKVFGWWHSSYAQYCGVYREEDPEHFDSMFTGLDNIIVLSQDDGKKIEKRYKIKPIVLYNAIEFDEEKKCNYNAKNMLMVGRYASAKGFDRAISALAILRDNGLLNDWKIKIVGDGSEAEKLQKAINDNKLNDTISLTGKTNSVDKYYRESSIFLLPSRIEGFPMALVEAMSFGLPVVAMDLPVFHEILTNDDFITPQDDISAFADKIAALMDSTKIRTNIGKENKQKSKSFSTDIIIQQWIDIVESSQSNSDYKKNNRS